MARLHRQIVETMAQARGLKMTPQRRAIIDYMQSAHDHPTADEVLQMVNRKFPMTSRATVYNTLNWLKQEGMIKEFFEAGCVRFDPNTGHHHHFVCRKCGKVEDVECDLVGTVKICSLPASQKVEFFEITIRGLCANCQKRK
jgi:Fur family transcriptional regulator, peroxide stress response regulator